MKLKELRTKDKLTQKQVSHYLNTSETNYNRYELGKVEPDIDTLIKLADFYHCSLDELVGRESDMLNLNALEPEIGSLIRKIIKMNTMQKAQTINFVTSLTMFDN